jgi:Zn-dependent alcohol dehydrogenase
MRDAWCCKRCHDQTGNFCQCLVPTKHVIFCTRGQASHDLTLIQQLVAAALHVSGFSKTAEPSS